MFTPFYCACGVVAAEFSPMYYCTGAQPPAITSSCFATTKITAALFAITTGFQGCLSQIQFKSFLRNKGCLRA